MYDVDVVLFIQNTSLIIILYVYHCKIKINESHNPDGQMQPTQTETHNKGNLLQFDHVVGVTVLGICLLHSR